LLWLRGPELHGRLEVMHTTTTFVAPPTPVDLLVWTIPSPYFCKRRCLPSSLYTFPDLYQDLARYYQSSFEDFEDKVSPNLAEFY